MIPKKDNISIIGFMGAGKTTVGPIVASLLGMRYVELDEVIEQVTGTTIPDIFGKHGEPYFRWWENKTLQKALTRKGQVISCGGGVVLDPKNVDLLRENSWVTLLWISEETALGRLGGCRNRPLLVGKWEERTSSLYRERMELYHRAAHDIVRAEGRSPEEVAREIVEKWKRLWWN